MAVIARVIFEWKIMFLRKKFSFLSRDECRFIELTFCWLLRNFGDDFFWQSTESFFPTIEHLGLEELSSEDDIVSLFQVVKEHLGIQEWPCELKIVGDNESYDYQSLEVNSIIKESIANLDVGDDGIVTLYINRCLMGSANQLVYAISRSLCLYIVSTSGEDHPSGSESYDLICDIAAIYFGFGVFEINSLFSFDQIPYDENDSWQSSATGSLSANQAVYALIIFSEIKNQSLNDIIDHLKPHYIGKINEAVKLKNNRYSEILDVKKTEYSPTIRC